MSWHNVSCLCHCWLSLPRLVKGADQRLEMKLAVNTNRHKTCQGFHLYFVICTRTYTTEWLEAWTEYEGKSTDWVACCQSRRWEESTPNFHFQNKLNGGSWGKRSSPYIMLFHILPKKVSYLIRKIQFKSLRKVLPRCGYLPSTLDRWFKIMPRCSHHSQELFKGV